MKNTGLSPHTMLCFLAWNNYLYQAYILVQSFKCRDIKMRFIQHFDLPVTQSGTFKIAASLLHKTALQLLKQFQLGLVFSQAVFAYVCGQVNMPVCITDIC